MSSKASDQQELNAELMRFYNVGTLQDLVKAQAAHVERLQAKLPKTKFQNIRPPRQG
jgi:hypothetical protein